MRKLLGLVVVAAACGSHPSIDDFYKEQIQITCDFETKCCASIAGDVVYSDVAACEAANDNSADLAATKAAIAAGTLAYDSGAAGSCLDHIRSIYGSCSSTISPEKTFGLLEGCFDAVQGTGKAGATCDTSGDFNSCDNDTECVTTGESTTGTCVAASKAGADCSTTGLCVNNYYCDGTTSTCLKLKGDGAACEEDDECESGSCPSSTCTNVPVPATEFCTQEEPD